MPLTASATSRLSGFWSGPTGTEAVSLYAQAVALIADETAVRDGSVKSRGWTIRAEEMVTGAAGNGRPVYGYPAPGEPAWITFAPGTGNLLVAGVDFKTSDDYVWFDTDPLLIASVSYLTWSGGSASAAADGLWGEHLVHPESVQPQVGTVAALSDALVELCDSPATTGKTETVEDVWYDSAGAYRVITDIAGYVLPAGDTASVTTGAVLPLGTPLGTAWTLTRLGPAKPALAHLTTPADFHLGVTVGGITWFDTTVALMVDTVDGRTRVRWPLGGTQQDVDDFWAASHAYGLETGARTLAQAMDTRADPVGDPGPASLPVYVNPLEFVCRELLAGTGYALVVRPAVFGPAGVASATQRASVVRAAAGPHVTVIEYEDEIPQTAQVTPS